ncbi:hypothetical protein [Comamonas sp. AG1104]|uniref:hypothetical protein n=1 Tax=Comamonas sp. AG1104 TaxID=2183900 RepID=UPI0011C02B9A|nr:hypothetical protein [Comamonas sp. AG1104]
MSTVISGYGRRRPAAMFSLLKSCDAHEANRICPISICFRKLVQQCFEHIADMHAMYTRHEFKMLVGTLVLSAREIGSVESSDGRTNGHQQAQQALARISALGEAQEPTL